jgi:hypothetical protein
LEILIIQHLRRVVPIPEVSLLTGKKLHQSNWQISRTCSKKATRSVCTSTIVVSPDPLSPTPSTSLAMKTPENTEEGPGNPEPSDGDTQKEYSSD